MILKCHVKTFYPPPHFEDHTVMMHISLDRTNLNISTPDFHIEQHFDHNWTTAHTQNLANVPKVPMTQLYKHMIGQKEPILPFKINSNTEEGPYLAWKLLTHTGTYIGTIGMILAICISVYCFRGFWLRPATLRHWPYSPISLWHGVVEYHVEAATIYRSKGMVEKPLRPHKNHALHIEQEATRPESPCKQPVLSKAVPATRSLATKPSEETINFQKAYVRTQS